MKTRFFTWMMDEVFGENCRLGIINWQKTTPSGGKTNCYALQSPFTGEFHNSENRYWAYKRSTMKKWLEEWGLEYEDCDIRDGRGKAFAIKGWQQAKIDAQRS